MRRSQAAAPLSGAVLGALVAFLAQSITEVHMGECPKVPQCPQPPQHSHVTVLGITLGIAIGAAAAWAAVLVANWVRHRSLSHR